MIIIGIMFMFIGFILCLTIIGSIFGIPMMMFGFLIAAVGAFRRRKTVITNVVNVTHTPQAPTPDFDRRPVQPIRQLKNSTSTASNFSASPKFIDETTTLRTCTNCNTENSSDNRFCTNCGNSLGAAIA